MALNDVKDLAVNGQFEVYITKKGDLAAATGRDAFEQELRVRLTDRANELVGKVSEENFIDLLETQLERVAVAMEELEKLTTYTIEPSPDKVNTLEVRVVYDTGEELTFDVEA